MTRRRRRTGLAIAALLASAPGVAAAGRAPVARREAHAAPSPRPRVELQRHEQDRSIDVLADGRPFTAYLWPERLAKPVLFPIRSAGGHAVTRGFPLQPREGESLDHPHQVGLWFNHGDVNGVDFWNNSEARPPGERSRMGTIRHVAVESCESGDGQGALTVALAWRMPEGTTALHERATYTFTAAPARRVIERTTTLTAAQPVVFRDNKEGLFALRVARELEQPAKSDGASAARASPAPGGAYTSSEGLSGDAVWGTRARWVALAGRIGGEDVVLLVLDHPENPGHPTRWHARGYGLFAANPLGAGFYTDGRERLDLALQSGGSVRFRHRLVILTGRFSADAAEAEWRRFAAGPSETAR